MWHIFWHSIFYIYSGILWDISFGIVSDIYSGILSGYILAFYLAFAVPATIRTSRVEVQRCSRAGKEDEKGDEEKEKEQPLIKPNNPHLAGGEEY